MLFRRLKESRDLPCPILQEQKHEQQLTFFAHASRSFQPIDMEERLKPLPPSLLENRKLKRGEN